MELAFTADQLALRDGVREALTGLDGIDGPADPAAAAKRLLDVGLPVALLPEADGGLGLDELDLVLCLEETGRAAVPVPVVESCLVAPRLLRGDALRPATGLRMTAALDGSGLVPWPGLADVALIGDAHGVRRVPASAAEPVPAVDPQRALGRVPEGAGEELAVDPGVIAAAWWAGVLGTSAQLIGTADRALEITVGYVGERKQFGAAIGSFQAVKHALADAKVALELARPLVHAAAWSQSRAGPTVARDVSAAKVRAGEAAGLVARAALQCHGAMGYTREYPLHRWLTRIWALQAAWGTAAEHRAVLARELGLVPRRNG